MTTGTEYLTPEQSAVRLRWATKTVYRWLKAGWFDGAVQLPNGRWRIPADTIDAVRETEPAA
jgi:predicted site-specific integrase-resolvase